MSTLLQDLRYAVRILAKSPGFTAVAVLTLALGIGASTALFSVIHSVLLSPLPFLNSERLAYVESYWTPDDRGASSGPDYLDWAERSTNIDGLCAMAHAQPNLTGRGEPLALQGLQVSANFFAVVEPRMTLGRGFSPEEGQAGAPKAAVLGYRLWRDRFASDPQVVGKVITLDDAPHTVVGVSSANMGFLEKNAQIYVPLQKDRLSQQRDEHYLIVLGRRKATASWEQVQAEMLGIAGQLQKEYPQNKDKSVRIHPLHEFLVSNLRPTLLILYGAVSLLLTIACVNVSNLLMVGAAGRARELAVRRSLGASRSRVARQLLTESLTLSGLGGALGLLFAYYGVVLLRWTATQIDLPGGIGIPGLDQLHIDLPVLAFASLLSLIVGVFFGTLPAWQTSRRALNTTLKESTQAALPGRARHRAMAALVVAQVALSLILLCGAGLLARSYLRLTRNDPGFNTDGLLALRVVRPSTPATREAANRAAFFERATERLAALPGVVAAGAVSLPPVTRENQNSNIRIDDLPPDAERGKPWAELRSTTPGYFACLRIPLLRGRAFDARDVEDSQRVVLVNQELARRYFANREPIGRTVGFDGAEWTIVGVVGDVKLRSLRSTSSPPTIYRAIAQKSGRAMTLFVRTMGDPSALVSAARQAIWQIDPNQPILQAQTMGRLLLASVFIERACTFFLAILAGLALAIGSVGLYAVMSATVSERRSEIGVRMVLGAQQGEILRSVLARGAALTTCGLIAGLAGAFALSRLMGSLLFDVSAQDPATFILVPLLLSSVALLACWIPARRAAKLDPMVALRCE
jgi:putative ABC transport system permease protein